MQQTLSGHTGNNQLKQVLVLLGLSVLIRSLAASFIGPGFDEAYYYLFSQFPTGGYFDHPPLVAFTAGFGRWITGLHHPLILRLGAILWFTVAAYGFYPLARDLYGHNAGILALLLLHAAPFFLVGAGAFVIPDNALVAAWIWFLVVLNRLRNSERLSYGLFALLGLLFGTALLAKYHAVFLPAAFGLASIYDKKLQRFWAHPGLYLALVLSFIVFSPCLIWNYQNGWISFVEQFGKSGGEVRFRLDLIGQAIGGQLGYLTPWIFVAIWTAIVKQYRNSRGDHWLYPFFLLPVLAFTIQGLFRGILPHWTMPGYIAGIVIASGYFAHGIGSADLLTSKTVKWLTGSITVTVLLVALVILQANLGLFPLEGKSDPTLDPAGWSQAIGYLESQELLENTSVLFVHKWFTGGELAWADRNRHPIVHLGGKPHMFAWWYPPGEYLGKSGFFITQKRYRLKEKDVNSMLRERFETVEEITVPSFKSSNRDMEMVVYRVTGFSRVPEHSYGPQQDHINSKRR